MLPMVTTAEPVRRVVTRALRGDQVVDGEVHAGVREHQSDL
jgi:hypothetical protein